MVCAWKADPSVFGQSTPPVAVFSLGAGVDHLHTLADRPEIPVVRVVDPDLTMRMVEYVTFAVLHLHRKIGHYMASQALHAWAPVAQPAASHVRVGILGMGVLGKACAAMLQTLGFQVAGWARTPSADGAFPIHAGADALGGFLASTDILVNLLPATALTRGLIGQSVFAGLARTSPLGAPGFVNAGRGEVVREDELVQALRDGTLGGAVLDVFASEPLPAESPLWAMPNVLLTPHVAADSDPAVVVSQIMQGVQRIEQGLSLLSCVDWSRGY